LGESVNRLVASCRKINLNGSWASAWKETRMGTIRLGARLAAGCLIAWGGVATVWAANTPTVQQMLSYRPKQDLVQVSTPNEAELSVCKVELVNGPGTFSGYLLRDGRGLPLRKFGASKGPKAAVDTYSYYLDGQEVYREIDTNGNGKIDQYRWLGAGGTRWGVDVNEDGQIDGWRMISAEEVSQEILRAVATRNVARLQALTPSEQELKALELSPQEMTRIHESVAKIPAKFQETVGKLGQLSENTRWLHLETTPPQCQPTDATGSKYDLIYYRSGTIVYEANGKADFLQTGEMIQVGRAWRLVGGPTPGHDIEMLNPNVPGQLRLSEEVKPLIDQLGTLDKNAPRTGDTAATVRYNLERAALLEQIAAKVDPKDTEQWIRQIADCLSAAAQSSGPDDTSSYRKLVALRDRIAKAQPGSLLAGYITYREMSAEYANKLAKPSKNDELAKTQESWRDRLKKFIEEYPQAEDAPDALLQLGMISEFVNKDTEAKNYYDLLVRNHARSPLATKAQGALRRLTSDGKEFALTGPELGTGQPIDVARLRGKVVVVYYWASWNQQCAADFFKLKSIVGQFGSKGLELVCVNLDNSPAEAEAFVRQAQAPGTHLHQVPGGLDSPLAVQYGVMVLPNLFLVGADGKVVSHTVQMSGLEDEVKKLMDK
jgi:hypothetical protein